MRRLSKPIVLSIVAATTCASLAFAASVGSGASNSTVAQTFLDAYNRGTFATLVSNVLNDVHALGTGGGLVQEYSGKANASQTYAIINPNPTITTGPNVAWQVYQDLYSYYNTLTAAVVGYPTMDTASCPKGNGTCDYQLFTNDYALFVYSSPAGNYALSDPGYTEWMTTGGMNGKLGQATGAAATVTSAAGTSGTAQQFATGAIYAYPPSVASAPAHAVVGTIYGAYTNAGGYAVYGFPTSEEVVLSGVHQQSFELGRIQYTPGSSATVIPAIAQIYLQNSVPGNKLNQGTTVTLTAVAVDIFGNIATGRTLTWSSSNSSVLSVVGNGNTTTVMAAGAGTAECLSFRRRQDKPAADGYRYRNLLRGGRQPDARYQPGISGCRDAEQPFVCAAESNAGDERGEWIRTGFDGNQRDGVGDLDCARRLDRTRM